MRYLREAERQDAELLFQWVNECSVRRNSFSSDEITLEEHMKWFEQVLSRNDIKQYIFMDEKEPVGQIRIKISDCMAELSYSICLEKRCMGYGKEMITLLKEQVKADFPEVKRMVAKVKPDNAASEKVFLDAGYIHKFNTYELDMNASVPQYEQLKNSVREGGYC